MSLLRVVFLAASLLNAVAFIHTQNKIEKVVDEAVVKVLERQRDLHSTGSFFTWKPWMIGLVPTTGATVLIMWVRRYS
jgi:hypothetical protein